MTDIYIFRSESGGQHVGSKWIFKGTMAPGVHDEYLAALRDDGSDDALANVLGKLYGEGSYMVFDLSLGVVRQERKLRRIDAVYTTAYKAKPRGEA